MKSEYNVPSVFLSISPSLIVSNKFPFPYISRACLPSISILTFPLHSLYGLFSCSIDCSKSVNVIV